MPDGKRLPGQKSARAGQYMHRPALARTNESVWKRGTVRAAAVPDDGTWGLILFVTLPHQPRRIEVYDYAPAKKVRGTPAYGG